MTYEDVLRQLTAENLRIYGARQVAYVKPDRIEGSRVFGVHSASGEELARYTDRDIAFAACVQHSLEPLSVH